MAQFVLPAKAVSRAVAHRTVEEIWCFVSGYGRMWRLLDGHDEITEVGPGSSVTIPVGTHFQFRCDSDDAPIIAIGAAMPPWPGEAEAYAVEGCWQPTV
ncbi:MAG: cupin domain-containing protein [Acetobacteraceae bacterium]